MLQPNRVSPLEIQMALHYRTRPTPYAEHEPEHRNSPAVARVHQLFLSRGYIVHAAPENNEKYGTEFEATEALHVWADALCAVPRPRQSVIWECKG